MAQAAVAAGADVVVLCDTNGGMLPLTVAAGRRRGAGRTGASGSASTARTTPAARSPTPSPRSQAGATHVQCTANGYGERAGNADLFAVVGNLVTKLGLPVLPDGRLAEMMRVSHAIAEIANMPPTPTRPTSGRRRSRHKAGLHASAIKVDPELYNHIDPTLVGNDMQILVTEMAGRATVELKARELGVDLAGPPGRGRPESSTGQGPGGGRLVVRGRRRLVRAADARRARPGRDAAVPSPFVRSSPTG